jgi:hypothetical protein
MLSRLWIIIDWFGMVNEFIDHLYTRLIITLNCSATSNLDSSQIITAHAKPFPAYSLFTSRFLATASNNGEFSTSHANVLSSQTPAYNWLNLASKSKSKLLYDWRFTASQFVLAPRPLRLMIIWTLGGDSPYVTSPLTRRWICLLWIFMSCHWKFFPLHYIQVLYRYRLSKADHANLTYPMLQRQVDHWLSSNLVPCLQHLLMGHIEKTVLLLLRLDSLLWGCIYRAVA